MKIIISENQSLFLKRRLSLIDQLVDYALYDDETFDEGFNLSDYEDEICWRVYDLLYEEGHDVDNNTEDLFNFIKEIFGEKIKSHYYELQGNVVNDSPDFDDE